LKRTTVAAAIAIVAGLTLSGCGITDSDDGVDNGTHSTNSPSDMTRENKGTTRKGG